MVRLNKQEKRRQQKLKVALHAVSQGSPMSIGTQIANLPLSTIHYHHFNRGNQKEMEPSIHRHLAENEEGNIVEMLYSKTTSDICFTKRI